MSAQSLFGIVYSITALLLLQAGAQAARHDPAVILSVICAVLCTYSLFMLITPKED